MVHTAGYGSASTNDSLTPPPRPWPAARSFVSGVGLSAASLTLAVLAFPHVAFGPLILVAFVPMIVAQHAFLTRRMAGLAFALGIGGFYVAYAWGVLPDDADGRLRGGILLFAGALVVLGAFERFLHDATDYRYFTVLAPLAWVAIDFLRAGVPQVSTWGYPAYALFDSPAVLQPVSVTGILGLNLLVLLVNWSVAGLILAGVRPKLLGWRRARRRGTVVGIATLIWLVAGFLMIENPAPSIRVAAVQPGSSGYVRSATAGEGTFLPAGYTEATLEAASRGARLVVWPEYGLPYDPRRVATAELRDLAAEADTYIAIGYGEFGPTGNRNEAVVLTPDGRFLGPYGKQHPVTILGEESTTRYGYPVYETEVGRIATILCYDLDFLDTARAVARGGAQLVAVPSQDWGSIAHKHYPLLVFRAIENRMAMVKADWGYDSAVIDPYGRILDRTISSESTQGLLVADVPLRSGRTIANRIGDWPGWVLVAIAAGVVAHMASDVRRSRRSRPA